ncbi:unnamed protein product, partial [Lymnaea stagnalis]
TELVDDRNLLDKVSDPQQSIGLSQSHSCMELCTLADPESSHMTLYEKEEIPLEPGTVMRTRQEIEDRQRY